MFAGMIKGLKDGRQPDSNELKIRLAAAITKKLGVIRQPPACWSADSKINPNSTHMLWAAILLGDRDGLMMITGIIDEENRGKDSADPRADQLRKAADALLALTPDPGLKDLLVRKISEMRRADDQDEPGSPVHGSGPVKRRP